MACCAAPQRRRRRRGQPPGTPSRGESTEAQQQAYGELLKTISAATAADSEATLSPVHLEVQRDLRLELAGPAAKLQPSRNSALLGRPRSPTEATRHGQPPPRRRAASPAPRGGGRASPQLPTKDQSSSSEDEQDSDSDGSTSEDEDDSSAATQFARRLRANHFDPATIFTAFDQQGTVRAARPLKFFHSPLILTCSIPWRCAAGRV